MLKISDNNIGNVVGTIVSFEYDHHANNIDTVTGIVIDALENWWVVKLFDPYAKVWVLDEIDKRNVRILSEVEAFQWILENE